MDKNDRIKFISELRKFDMDQFRVINGAHLFGFTDEEIALFAIPELSRSEMMLIVDCIKSHKNDTDILNLVSDVRFNYCQRCLIMAGFDTYNLSYDEVKSYANPELSYMDMNKALNAILNSK